MHIFLGTVIVVLRGVEYSCGRLMELQQAKQDVVDLRRQLFGRSNNYASYVALFVWILRFEQSLNDRDKKC